MTEISGLCAKIMIVDDNAMNLVLLERVLENQGHTVISVDRGTKVIETAEKDPPDLILLDFAMPEMDGNEVCQRLKKHPHLNDIPVIFISALSDTNDKVRALEAGAVDYVTKPFHSDEVLARIDVHLKIRCLQKQLEEKNAILQEEISRRMEAENELKILAATDPLTKVYNRRHFFNLATKELSRSRRSDSPFSIMMIDIDNFKNINDTYGHLIGDRVLIRFAEICQKNIREYDVLARYGGEEFVVLLPNTDVKRATEIAERLRKDTHDTTLVFDEIILYISTSIGVSCYNSDTPLPLDKILDRSDQALYWSKNAGRNRVSVWE